MTSSNNTPGHKPNTKRISIDVPAHLHQRFKAGLPKGGMTHVVAALLRALPKTAISKAVADGKSLKFKVELL
jgi:phytoene dehydrogenase-like protein